MHLSFNMSFYFLSENNVYKFSLLTQNFSKKKLGFTQDLLLLNSFFRNIGRQSRAGHVEQSNITEAYQVCLLVLATTIQNFQLNV